MSPTARWADALWRAVTYVSVVMSHLDDNVVLHRRLEYRDVKVRPCGHWGTVPGTALALVHARLLRSEPSRADLVPLLCAGHAGVVQLALSWLTGDLEGVRGRFTLDASGLTELARSFPDVDGLGAEVNPRLPDGGYLGGWLGGALAFAQGYALDAAGQVVLPIVGDGECETPTTAAAWLAHRQVGSAAVVPLVQVNGFRMGGPSLLGVMTNRQLTSYFRGQGWSPRLFTLRHGNQHEHRRLHVVMKAAVDATERGTPTVIVVRCAKGWGGPARVGDRQVLGTRLTHKTPLGQARDDPGQLEQLRRWLASYRPSELFDAHGRPTGALAEALDTIGRPTGSVQRPQVPPQERSARFDGPHRAFGDAVTSVLRHHAAAGDLRVFSPDELASNHLAELATEPWATELLAEEVLMGWLAGWTASGRRGVLVTYEAFAPLLTSGLVAHLKQRRLAPEMWPSLNLVLTSYGWHNVYTHGDPSLATCLLALGDPAVRVFTPADPDRTAAALDDALHTRGRVNVIIAGKHQAAGYPMETLPQERTRGLAVWPHLSDDGEPDLTIVAAGDLPASVVTDATAVLRAECLCRIRVVNVTDLTVLDARETWPAGLTDEERTEYLGAHAPVLVVTLGHPAAIRGLIAGALPDRRVDVIGWQEPPDTLSKSAQAEACGMTPEGVRTTAVALLARRTATT